MTRKIADGAWVIDENGERIPLDAFPNLALCNTVPDEFKPRRAKVNPFVASTHRELASTPWQGPLSTSR